MVRRERKRCDIIAPFPRRERLGSFRTRSKLKRLWEMHVVMWGRGPGKIQPPRSVDKCSWPRQRMIGVAQREEPPFDDYVAEAPDISF